jgi:hypothetical protein
MRAFMGTKGVLDRLAPDSHLLGMLVEPALNSLEDVLMLPARDASLRPLRAL